MSKITECACANCGARFEKTPAQRRRYCEACRTRRRAEAKADSRRRHPENQMAAVKRWKANNRERVREVDRRRDRSDRTRRRRELRMAARAAVAANIVAAPPVLALLPGPPAVRKAPKPRVRQSPKPRLFVAGFCGECADAFVTQHAGTRFCSRRCERSESRRRRRALKKGAFVARVYTKRIYERDGWRCQLCGKKVRRLKVVPHPLAPVLDHIVPLACGGSHEPANVQCAHFICNSRKRDSAMNEQLRLVG